MHAFTTMTNGTVAGRQQKWVEASVTAQQTGDRVVEREQG
jgi:hypothetical protein